MSAVKTTVEQQEAIDRLRELFPPGSRATTVLRHVSKSGMTRSISVLAVDESGEPWDVSWMVARVTGSRIDRDRGGVKVQGCGMDMGFQLVYTLSRILYPDGFTCTGSGDPGSWQSACPSNDHSNGDRLYGPHHHADGGYAIRHRWL